MNASFKPFAAIGFEYQKVSPSGQAGYGNRLKFSLPMFGDFIGDMVLHVTLAAPVITRNPSYPVTNANAGAFRWCHFPGERLLQQTRFTVAGNELDSYSSASINMYREVNLPVNKRNVWYRSVGQELPTNGWITQPGINGAPSLNADLSISIASTGLINDVNGPIAFRNGLTVLNGPQTPAPVSSSLDLWIPLLFWFNLDPRLILPSVALPNTNRDVEFTFANSNQMYGMVPRGFASYADPKATATDSDSPITVCELFVNNLFVQPEVHDIFIKRIGFTLIRVHREHLEQVTEANGSKLLSNLKWPIEALFVGIRIASYETSNADIDKWYYFSKAGHNVYDSKQIVKASSGGTPLTGSAVAVDFAGNLTLTGGQLTTQAARGDTISIGGFICQIISIFGNTSALISPSTPISSMYLPVQKLATATISTIESSRTVDTMTIKAHGVNLYNNISSKFYSDYLPFRYSNQNGSDDLGVMSIFFCLYPGAYQPSGHINVSRAREFYLDYTSSIISATVPGNLVVVASAINFLLISDGSAVLRYTT